MRLGGPIVQVVAHGVLDVAEAVSAKVLAAVPACHHDDFADTSFALQHAQDYHPRARLSVVVFQGGAVGQQDRPSVMRRARELLVAAQRFDERLGRVGGRAWPA